MTSWRSVTISRRSAKPKGNRVVSWKVRVPLGPGMGWSDATQSENFSSQRRPLSAGQAMPAIRKGSWICDATIFDVWLTPY